MSYKKHLPRSCPVCGNAEVKLLFTQEFAKIDGLSFLDSYDVVSCERCCFVYASDIPEQAVFDEYYVNSNKYEHEIEQPDIITGEYEHIVREISGFVCDKSTSIVDVGCAKSEVLRSLRNLGFSNLTGIDPSVKNVEYLKGKGINGIHATIKAIDTSKQYEVVMLLAVLEHIQDLHQTMKILYAITAVDGILVIWVPDLTAPVSTELPFQEFSTEHINYFTEVSLSNLMMKHGYNSLFFKKRHGEILGFFRKESKSFLKDIGGERRIQYYIGQSEKYENIIYANLMKYQDIPIIVWGLGTFTRRLLGKNLLKKIVVIVDSNPDYAGKKYNDVDIIHPDELRKYREPILLAVSLRYLDDITYTIKDKLRLENEIIKVCTNYTFEYQM
jgi:SAM-dependent methyltransferase